MIGRSDSVRRRFTFPLCVFLVLVVLAVLTVAQNSYFCRRCGATTGEICTLGFRVSKEKESPRYAALVDAIGACSRHQWIPSGQCNWSGMYCLMNNDSWYVLWLLDAYAQQEPEAASEAHSRLMKIVESQPDRWVEHQRIEDFTREIRARVYGQQERP
jgi:hypothetical protein